MSASCNHVGEVALTVDGFMAQIVGCPHSDRYVVVIDDGRGKVLRNVLYNAFRECRL